LQAPHNGGPHHATVASDINLLIQISAHLIDHFYKRIIQSILKQRNHFASTRPLAWLLDGRLKPSP
jgi:hypothetical protein